MRALLVFVFVFALGAGGTSAAAKASAHPIFFWALASCIDYFKSGSTTWFSRQHGGSPGYRLSKKPSVEKRGDRTGGFTAQNGAVVGSVAQVSTKQGPHLLCSLDKGGPIASASFWDEYGLWLKRAVEDGVAHDVRAGGFAFSVCNLRGRRALVELKQVGSALVFRLSSLRVLESGRRIALKPCDAPDRGPLGKLNRPFEEDV